MALFRILLISTYSLLFYAVPAVGAAEFSSDAPQGIAGSTIYGIHEANSWRRPVAAPTPTQVGEMLQGTHAEAHRWDVLWNDIERQAPVNGVHRYDFSEYDPMYAADLARGIKPLIMIMSAPPWARSPDVRQTIGRGIPPDTQHIEDWADFCAEVTRRYPQAVGIEIWNEPNLTAFWGRGLATVPPDPAYYVRLLSSAHKAIKSVDPSMPVIGGALSNAQQSLPTGQISGVAFATAMFENGAAQYMDGMSIHAAPIAPGFPDHTLFKPTIDQLRRAREIAGSQVPIWLTEVSVTTNPGTVMTATEEQQASILSGFFWWVQTQADIEAFFVHTLTERNPGKGYALMTGDALTGFKPKPAYTALTRAASDSGPAPSAPLATSPGTSAFPSTHPLDVRVKAARTLRLRRQGWVPVWIRCNQSCTAVAHGTARVRFGDRTRRSRLRVARVTLASRQRTRIVVRLRGSARRTLRRGGRGTVRVKVLVRNASDNQASDVVAFRVRR